MAGHAAAWYASVDGSSAYAALTALADSFFAANGTSHLPPRDLKLLAAACGGVGLLRARIEAAGLARVAYPHITPVQATLTTATDMPRVCDYSRRPIGLTAGEGLSVKVQNAGAAGTVAVLFTAFDVQALPDGEGFLIRYSVTGATAATANTWSSYLITDVVPLAWETSLPSGTYVIVGMDHWGATAMAARLILPGYRNRPGCLARTSATAAMNDPIFMDGRLGILGYFSNWQMPGIEVLCTGADTAFEGVIKVIRIGGPEMMPGSR